MFNVCVEIVLWHLDLEPKIFPLLKTVVLRDNPTPADEFTPNAPKKVALRKLLAI